MRLFLLVLLFSVVPILSDRKLKAAAILKGVWADELGSTMEITAASKGIIEGFYSSAVGDAKKFYTLRGTYDSDNIPTTLAFAVSWNNSANGDSKASTAWSGQLLLDREIRTTWTMTELTDVPNLWKSTLIGKNYFTRI
eukprot:TRINITY_DN14764_c0_g1_i1.p1 TRINITY_DN14764_c0_g1~~TRINITY_DN14764_c0_g1_i1.p1  ORF type:complete len:139 (-),score=20.84 TRINITY_DN14764_c0_g1_i1:3-419(-)